MLRSNLVSAFGAWTGRAVLHSCGTCVVFPLYPDGDELIISNRFCWECVTIPCDACALVLHTHARTHTALDHLTLVAMTAAVRLHRGVSVSF